MIENIIILNDIKEFVNSFKLFDNFKNKSFLITGITGLIGSVSAKCLIGLSRTHNLNIHIIGIVRNIDKANSIFDGYNEIEFINVDIDKIEELDIKVNYILHFASPTSSLYFIKHPIEVYNIITKGTESVLKYARNTQAESIVYASSLEIYGSISHNGLINEDIQGYINPLSERSSYPLGKRAAEFMCYTYYKQHSLPIKIARLTQTLGAGAAIDDNRVIAQFAKKAIMNEDIIINSSGNTARPICYTTDAVSAILHMLINGENGEAYNIANPETYMSIKDMAQFVKTHFAPNINIRFEFNPTKGYAPDTMLNLDVTKLYKLGWKPRVDLRQIYERLILYFKTNENL